MSKKQLKQSSENVVEQPKVAKKGAKTVEETFKVKTDQEHALSEPDMYVGSLEPDDVNLWLLNDLTKKCEYKTVTVPLALYKIFDEIMVNTRDHTIRDKTCKNIKVTIDEETGRITVWNDGQGIPVQIHAELKKYVPHIIFGLFRSSSNYDTKGKTVGGKNGYGAKLTNLFSKEFTVETVDSDSKKFFSQTYKNNMFEVGEPLVQPSKAKSYTMISFIPDFPRFKCKKLTKDTIALFKRRVYDIAACTNVNVYLNDEIIKIKEFQDYINMYYNEPPEHLVYGTFGDRWKVAVVFNQEEKIDQVSFVNGISTFNGGTHVAYIAEQICKFVIDEVVKKNKGLIVKPEQVKQHITLFLDSVIEDPQFGSQSKDKLVTPKSKFGSKCELTQAFFAKLKKTGIIDAVADLARFKQDASLKKTDGKKNGGVNHIEKLDDAKWAGTAKSSQTLLILTEGDSAKAFALAGLEVIGNLKYGVFPLKGKILNVKSATPDQLANNAEFVCLKTILGLKQGVKYTSTKELRYGGILILTDQDADGSHIKGLLINLIHTFWPSLLMETDYIKTLRTPLLKAFKQSDKQKKNGITFYSMSEYKTWVDRELKGDTSKWNIKYYKGLGTSTDKEAMESFIDFDDKIITFVCDEDEEKDNDDELVFSETMAEVMKNGLSKTSNDAIMLAFGKEKKTKAKKDGDDNEGRYADKRKKWLKQYDPNNILEYETNQVTYGEFIHKELIHFSNADVIRSIPSIVDGFKPSLRKVFYAALERGEKAPEIKVSQFAGYVSQITEYHHGEASLMQCIIGMAQNFIGSNNINTLMPNGNFGYRKMLGKEHASPRYIFTALNDLMMKIFRPEDRKILDYLIEDNTKIEPIYFVPIFPMVLVNGASGIGTGYSTDIPKYNPKDIVETLINMIDEKHCNQILPWYRGFTGTIEPIMDKKNKTISSLDFVMKGRYEIIDETTVHVSEIPINFALDDYKAYLMSVTIIDKNEKAPEPKKTKQVKKAKKSKDDEKKEKEKDLEKRKLESFDMKPYNNIVDVTLKFKPTELQKLEQSDGLEKFLKISTTFKLTNMHLYNAEHKIVKYFSPMDIISDFYDIRYEYYEKRKEYMIKSLENDLMVLKYRVKYINDILNKTIIVERQKKDVVLARLEELKYPKLNLNIDTTTTPSYDYLSSMLIFSLTYEKIDELNANKAKKEEELERYRNTPIEKIWKDELNEFLVEYEKWYEEMKKVDVAKPKKTRAIKTASKK